jgi:cytochrome c oxidase cbb3-type subunit 1
MGLFGAIYYIVPRLLGLEWPSSDLLRSHFWLFIVGAGLLIIGSILGGCIQGLGLSDAKVPPIAILSFLKPFFVSDFVAMLILIAGEVCLTASFLLMLLRGAWALFALRPSATPAHVDASLAPQTAVPVS